MRIDAGPLWPFTVRAVAVEVARLVAEVDRAAEVRPGPDGFRVWTWWPRPVARVLALCWHDDGPLAGTPADCRFEVQGFALDADDMAAIAAGRRPVKLDGYAASVGAEPGAAMDAGPCAIAAHTGPCVLSPT